MVEKLFVLGCPGSGKSTVSRHIAKLAYNRGRLARTINDYKDLYMRFLADAEHEYFLPAAYDGFEVVNTSVYDTALDELKEQAQKITDSSEGGLVIVEFSRGDYSRAFKHFGNQLLNDAHFLLLDADIDTCMQRVKERITRRVDLDDHFVPENIIE